MPPLRGPNKKCWKIFNAACAARSGELILALDEQLLANNLLALEDLSKPEPRPIVSAEELAQRAPDVTLLLAWNFADEILTQ